MYLTVYDLAGYVWKKYSRFWTEKNIRQLIRKKELTPRYLRGRMIFKTQEIEDYFERHRRNKRTA